MEILIIGILLHLASWWLAYTGHRIAVWGIGPQASGFVRFFTGAFGFLVMGLGLLGVVMSVIIPPLLWMAL